MAALAAWVATIGPEWLYHPLGQCAGDHAEVIRCKSYNLWSGSVSDISEITLIFAVSSGVVMMWRKHNCHEHRCWRLSWHPDEDGHPVCKKHHPDHPSRGLWWAIKHWVKTREFGDHSHPRHARHPSKVQPA
jgi:hypothetical protein